MTVKIFHIVGGPGFEVLLQDKVGLACVVGVLCFRPSKSPTKNTLDARERLPGSPCSVLLEMSVDILQTLLLDQRGTGLSTPVTTEFLTSFPTDADRARYLENFRADSIG